MKFERSQVLHAARNGIPLVIKTHSLPPETEADLEEILMIYLEELGQDAVKDHLAYCLKELTVNAKKANTKRVYFKEKGLNLDNPEDYEKGMKSFKSETLGNIQHYLELQEQQDLYIKVTYLIRNNMLHFSVRNNAPIKPKELTRVYDRLARSRAFESMEEAFAEVLDDSEGAGLGIVIMILMLRKMGLNEKSFDLNSQHNETVASLAIPMNKLRLEQVTQVGDEILNEIESLPPFPENLQRLQASLSNPDVKLEQLATQLSSDPAMISDLLRYVNSAKYGMRKKIETIQDAIKIVGIRGIKDLVYPYGAHKLLDRYMEKQRDLWKNAARVSAYSSELARLQKLDKDEQSQAQTGGILYNLGQIILSFINPKQSKNIMDFCRAKSFSIEIFDELTNAINPTEVGYRIAKKWDFPEELVNIIRYQNQPQLADPKLQHIVCTIHLAGSLLSVEHNLLSYAQINPLVLKALGLTDLDKLEAQHKLIKANYEKVLGTP